MARRLCVPWAVNRVSPLPKMLLLSLTSHVLLRLQLTVWLVPSLVGNAVAVSIIGFFLGPLYPIAMNHASRILPPWLLTGSIGWMAGFGTIGGAIVPFITGALAGRVGLWSLQPL